MRDQTENKALAHANCTSRASTRPGTPGGAQRQACAADGKQAQTQTSKTSRRSRTRLSFNNVIFPLSALESLVLPYHRRVLQALVERQSDVTGRARFSCVRRSSASRARWRRDTSPLPSIYLFYLSVSSMHASLNIHHCSPGSIGLPQQAENDNLDILSKHRQYLLVRPLYELTVTRPLRPIVATFTSAWL